MTFRRFRKARDLLAAVAKVPRRLDLLQQALGRVESRQLDVERSFDRSGFRVYSQWDEDGLIQFLLRHVVIDRPNFVEFGVEDYRESNTRFLLLNQNWTGLVIDASGPNVAAIRSDDIYWRYDLTAVCAFVEISNINQILTDHGVTGDTGLLSVDIDGNDYWIWRAIDAISPRIVICEYNGLFGPRAAVTVPHQSGFHRPAAHYSGLYAGASLAALAHLGESKGYCLIGTNIAGNNAFFVRRDCIAGATSRSAADVYRQPRFREARNPDGTLSFLPFEAALQLIGDLNVVDVTTNQVVAIKDIPR